ncbi:MAG: DMT family transporter [Ruminococcaceae bacterium]|nr:DMT family transporter [Oscillospiraceae bacterium]
MNSERNSFFSNPISVALIACFCCALWGSATPFIKIGSPLMIPDDKIASTMLFAGIRFFLAGCMVILYSCITCRRFVAPKIKNIRKITWVAMFQTVIQYVFFYIGVANTTAVKATLGSGCGSFSAILVTTLIFRSEKLTLKKLLACLIGFLGILLVHFDGLDFTMNFLGDGFVLLATIAYGVSASLIKRYSDLESPVVISGYQFLIGGLIMTAIGILFGGTVIFSDFISWYILLYLALLSAVAYSLWGILLKYNPLSKVAVYGFMIPVFGVILSQLILTENSSLPVWRLYVALVLVSFGIYWLNYEPKQKKRLF